MSKMMVLLRHMAGASAESSPLTYFGLKAKQ